jgi:hypothetical protein
MWHVVVVMRAHSGRRVARASAAVARGGGGIAALSMCYLVLQAGRAAPVIPQSTVHVSGPQVPGNRVRPQPWEVAGARESCRACGRRAPLQQQDLLLSEFVEVASSCFPMRLIRAALQERGCSGEDSMASQGLL